MSRNRIPRRIVRRYLKKHMPELMAQAIYQAERHQRRERFRTWGDGLSSKGSAVGRGSQKVAAARSGNRPGPSR